MKQILLSAAIVAGLLTGCDSGNVKEKSIEVQPNRPLEQAKQLLEKYSKGQAVGSEATSYSKIVEDVRKDDPARADILEKGFAELQKPKINVAAKAKEILGKLGAQTGYPKG